MQRLGRGLVHTAKSPTVRPRERHGLTDYQQTSWRACTPGAMQNGPHKSWTVPITHHERTGQVYDPRDCAQEKTDRASRVPNVRFDSDGVEVEPAVLVLPGSGVMVHLHTWVVDTSKAETPRTETQKELVAVLSTRSPNEAS